MELPFQINSMNEEEPMKKIKYISFACILGLLFIGNAIISVESSVNYLNCGGREENSLDGIELPSNHLPLNVFYQLKKGMNDKEVEAIIGKLEWSPITSSMTALHFAIDENDDQVVILILSFIPAGDENLMLIGLIMSKIILQ